MKEMIRFSLRRRFDNKSTKLFNIILFVVILCFAFADKIMEVVNPSMFEKEVIYVKNIEEELIHYLQDHAQEHYVFKESEESVKRLFEKGESILLKDENQYYLYSKYESGENVLAMFEMYINTYRKDQILKTSDNVELLLAYNENIQVENRVLEERIDLSQEKSNLIFLFLTSVYFMMLSFVSGVASEVVNEKATKVLELILTSVSAKEHFLAKLIVGWLVIVIQGGLSLSYILFSLLVRSMFDQGHGLIAFLKKLNIVHFEGNTFYAILSELDISILFFEKIGWVLLFLLLGILFVQLVLVIVSSFVSSVEEAGNIQAPFYLVLLGAYYLALSLNNPHDLNEGMGLYLSFVPFLNMLFMPCRLLMSEVALAHVLLSLSLSIVVIVWIIYKGIPVYERGVLDYSCKGFMQVVTKMHKSNANKEARIEKLEQLQKFVKNITKHS